MKNFADPGAVQQLYDVAQYATHRRITQIVFDLTGNAGGYVKQVRGLRVFSLRHPFTFREFAKVLGNSSAPATYCLMAELPILCRAYLYVFAGWSKVQELFERCRQYL